MSQLKDLLSWLAKQKYKIALISFLVSFFLFLLFPYGDLSDLVTSLIAKNTNNQVYVKFKNAHISIVPAGISLEYPLIETPRLPALEADTLTFSPNLQSVIFKKPGGSVSAQNFWGGEILGTLSPGPKSENGNELSKLQLSGQKLNVENAMEFLNSPLRLKGKADLDLNGTANLAFAEQPDLEIAAKLSSFQFLTSQINLAQFGSVILPEFKLSVVDFKGRLSGGQLLVQQATLGSPTDEIFGQIKGKMGLTLNNQGGQIRPEIGEYSFDVDLAFKKQIHDKVSFFLLLVSPYKTETPTGFRYRFKLAGSGTAGVPSFSKF